MPEILQIDLEHVHVAKQANEKYSLQLDWNIQQSAGAACTGPFFLIVQELGRSIAYPIVLTHGNESGYVINVPLEKEKNTFYTVIVSDKATAPYTKCQPVSITCKEYSGLSASYDGRYLDLKFTPPKGIASGEITLLPAGLPPEIHTFDPRINHLRLEVDSAGYLPDMAINYFLRTTMQKDSYGPSVAGAIMCGVPTISSADVNGEQLSVSCTLTSYVFTHRAVCTLSMVLLCEGNEIWRSEGKPLAEAMENVTLTGQVTDLATMLPACTVAVYVGTIRGENRALKTNQIPLSTPHLVATLRGQGAFLSWDGKPWDNFRIKLPNGTETNVTGTEYIIEQTPIIGVQVSIAAYAGKARCPFSAGISLFQPGFYVSTQEKSLRLYREAFEEKCTVLKFHSNLLPITAEPKATPPFALTYKNDSWLLSIDRNKGVTVTKELFTTFLDSLRPLGLNASGEYLLRRAVAYSGGVAMADTLWYFCRMERGSRCVDLFPGACLRIETAVYQPKLLPHSDDSGYIRSAATRYWVALSEQSGTETLQYNGNLNYVLGGWSDTYTGSNILPNAGGLADLFCESMRKPFARLYYPEGFHSSKTPSSSHAMNNICLAVSTTSTSFPDTLSALSKSDFKYLIMRGRSTITLEINILVDGHSQTIPLGTTLGDFANRLGLPSARRLELKRETGEDTPPLPVYLERASVEEANSLLLLAGDRLTVK